MFVTGTAGMLTPWYLGTRQAVAARLLLGVHEHPSCCASARAGATQQVRGETDGAGRGLGGSRCPPRGGSGPPPSSKVRLTGAASALPAPLLSRQSTICLSTAAAATPRSIPHAPPASLVPGRGPELSPPPHRPRPTTATPPSPGGTFPRPSKPSPGAPGAPPTSPTRSPLSPRRPPTAPSPSPCAAPPRRGARGPPCRAPLGAPRRPEPAGAAPSLPACPRAAAAGGHGAGSPPDTARGRTCPGGRGPAPR